MILLLVDELFYLYLCLKIKSFKILIDIKYLKITKKQFKNAQTYISESRPGVGNLLCNGVHIKGYEITNKDLMFNLKKTNY